MGLHKSIVICALCTVLGLVAPQISWCVEPAATQARAPEAIIADLQATSTTLHEVIPSLTIIIDDTQRKQVAEKAIPVLNKMSTLLVEYANVQKDPADKAGLLAQKNQFDSFLVAFGDKEAVKSLEERAKDPANDKSVAAKSALIVGTWWLNTKDAVAQAKAAR